jgi:hypothetical protein
VSVLAFEQKLPPQKAIEETFLATDAVMAKNQRYQVRCRCQLCSAATFPTCRHSPNAQIPVSFLVSGVRLDGVCGAGAAGDGRRARTARGQRRRRLGGETIPSQPVTLRVFSVVCSAAHQSLLLFN